MNKENIEKFRILFIEFENLTKNLIRNKNIDIKIHNNDIDIYDAIDKLKRKRIIPYCTEMDFLLFCKNCRNRVSHVNDDFKYIIYTDEFINKLENIIDQIKNPPTAYSLSTKNITRANIEENVKVYMQKMNELNYTHIPIYDQDKLVGIFSEKSIFNYLLKDEIIEIDENTTFEDIKEYISMENSKETIKFISKAELYNDVINEFINQFKQGKKLDCIMITENGVVGEKVIGIITSWDVLGRDYNE